MSGTPQSAGLQKMWDNHIPPTGIHEGRLCKSLLGRIASEHWPSFTSLFVTTVSSCRTGLALVLFQSLSWFSNTQIFFLDKFQIVGPARTEKILQNSWSSSIAGD